MSTLANSAVCFGARVPVSTGATRCWASRCWQALIFCSLFSIIFLPEFPRAANGADSSFLYGKAAGGFRFIDLGILALVAPHVAAWACSRRKFILFPRALALPGSAFLACIAMGVLYGYSRGGTNFFFDWRAIVLGIGLYCVWAFWMQSAHDIANAILLFVSYMAARMVLLYTCYLAGHQETLLGIPIPIFDGPVLSALVFTALLAFRHQVSEKTGLRRLFWLSVAIASYLTVLLCFRRTYWAELAIGTVLLLLLQQRHRIRNAVLVGSMICIAAVILGQPFSGRLRSLDFTQTDGEFSADNSDHMRDIQDAWDQVRQSPIMGIGVGTSYPTWRIRNWKNESVMVHNAPLHVWLKYGIAGLICYLWFHIALLRCVYHRPKCRELDHAAWLQAAAAYLTAQLR